MFIETIPFLLTIASFAAAIGSYPHVIDLTDKSFDDDVAAAPLTLVEFYAPWCGHCKQLAPVYGKAAETLQKETDKVRLAKIDCTTNEKTCQRFNVNGYPSMKIFRDGEFLHDYSGPRDAVGIARYMATESGPPSRELTTSEDLDAFLNHFEHSIVGFFSEQNSDIARAFDTVAKNMKQNYRFAHTATKAVLDKYGSYIDQVVVFQPPRLHSNLLESRSICAAPDVSQYSELKRCVKQNIHGPVGHRTQQNQYDFSHPLVNVYWEVDYTKNPKGSNYWRNRVAKVTKQHADKNVNFAYSSWDDFNSEIEEFGGLQGSDEKEAKPIVTAKDDKGRKFRMNEEFSTDGVNQFVEDFLANKLEPYLKSEPVPESNDAGVKIVVAKNFDQIVNDDTKDVLIEFYAPWCGHCKQLTPIYDRLGEAYRHEPNLVIAKMDATANDVPAPYNVQGFPTIYFKKRGESLSPKKYDGNREYSDFVKYLQREAGVSPQGQESVSKKSDKKGKKKSKKEQQEL